MRRKFCDRCDAFIPEPDVKWFVPGYGCPRFSRTDESGRKVYTLVFNSCTMTPASGPERVIDLCEECVKWVLER